MDIEGTCEQRVGGTGDEETSGLIRRVRRTMKLSQRELAHVLDVSQSAVAKWETGRTTPTVRMMRRILDLAHLSLMVVDKGGDRVEPMRVDAARDAGRRRYPAHMFVWAEGWWVPEGAGSTPYFDQILLRSAAFEVPRVRYSRRWQFCWPPRPADIQDHPTWPELVRQAREGHQPRPRRLMSVPDWAIQDSKKSRNRRSEDFRRLARGA